MSENTPTELLPCPFCGSRPAYDHTRGDGVRFSCMACDDAVFGDFIEAATFWNTRSPPTVAPEVVGWQPIETAPQPKWGEPRGYIMLAWTNIDRTTGAVTRAVGEGYWFENEDGEDGAFWWANTGPGNWAEDQISESITGQLTHWKPMPEPPPLLQAVEGVEP